MAGGYRPRVLLVDDERDLLGVLSEILEDSGYSVVSTWEGEEAVAIADLYDPDVVLTDFSLPGIDGVTTIERIRRRSPNTHAVLMSGHISHHTRQRAQKEADHILEKPLHIPELLRKMRQRRAAI